MAKASRHSAVAAVLMGPCDGAGPPVRRPCREAGSVQVDSACWASAFPRLGSWADQACYAGHLTRQSRPLVLRVGRTCTAYDHSLPPTSVFAARLRNKGL